MAIKTKNSGAYADVVGVSHKAAGTYAAVQGVYSKIAGAYASVFSGASPIVNPRIASVGDSLTQFGNGSVALNGNTLTRDAAGVVTVNKTNHGLYGNQPINIVNCSDAAYEAYATTTYIDSNNFSYPTNVTGAAGSIAGTANTAAVIQNRYQTIGAWAWLQGAFEGGLRFRGNFGQGGDRADQMTAAVALAGATDADIVRLLAGINDINGGASGATVITRVQALVGAILATGKKVSLLGITPLGSAFNSASRNTEILAANVGFAAMAAANPNNVFFTNAHSLLTDGTNNNQAYSWVTTDGIHWGPRAAKIVADAEKATLDSRVTATLILPTTSSDLPNVLGYTAIKQYGAWSGTGGGIAGTGVVGGSVITPKLVIVTTNAATTAVCSLVDRGADGYYQKVVVTPGGANHEAQIYMQSNSGESPASLGLVAGDTIQMAVELTVSGAVDAGLIKMQLTNQSQTSGLYGVTTVGQTDPNATIGNLSFTTVMLTGPLVVTASFTTLLSKLEARFAAASANTCEIQVGKVVLYKKNP